MLCCSLLIVFVGNVALNLAIPTLAREFEAPSSQLQWVIAAYSLTFAGLLFTGGAVGDRFGRKGVLQLGLLGFLCAATLATLSTEMWQLIGCRALMGASAAFIMPSTLSILVNVFPPHERVKAIAIWAGISGGAAPLGSLISGWLISRFWYGAVFLVNVPIVLVALVAGAFLVPRSRDPDQAHLDIVGAALSGLGITSLVYGLIEAPEHGWAGERTLVAFAVAAGALMLFVLWERHTDEPMLDIGYFRNVAFSVGTSGMVLVFMSLYGVIFLVMQYFQLVLGDSPLEAALRTAPAAPLQLLLAPFTPRLVTRFGANRVVSAGMAGIACSYAGLSFVTTTTPYLPTFLCVMVLVLGITLTVSPMTAAMMSAVPPGRAGGGSAMNSATRELGASLGIAVLGSITAFVYRTQIATTVDTLAPDDAAEARSSLGAALETAARLPTDVGARVADTAKEAFVTGLHYAVVTGALLAGSAAVVVLRLLPRDITPHRRRHRPRRGCRRSRRDQPASISLMASSRTRRRSRARPPSSSRSQ